MASAKPVPSTVQPSSELFRGDVMSAACPSREILNHLTSRWGVLVLISLLKGTKRFSDLRRGIEGVSERMLAQTLKSLESDGMVDRRALNVMPPHVEYTLTTHGHEAASKVLDLVNWLEGNLPGLLAARTAERTTKR